MQPYRLFQAEEEVHVVDCLAARSLQQVSIIETISSLSSCFNR